MEGPATCPMGPGDTVFGRSRNYLGALGLCDGRVDICTADSL